MINARALCKEIGNFFGEYFEENNQLCIDNYDKVFRYNTEKELLVDWVDTLICNHYDCKENGNIADSWEKEVRYIYEDVLGKYPVGVRLYNGKKKKRYVAEGYVSDGSMHGKMKYLGTFDSIIDAICAVWKHKGIRF